MFQSTYLYKVRRLTAISESLLASFNPRTYIRYDPAEKLEEDKQPFQSTYLYKVRPAIIKYSGSTIKFQSTYLYKVRHESKSINEAGHVSIHVPI